MGLFKRKTETVKEAPAEPEGRANIAKQISGHAISIEKSSTSARDTRKEVSAKANASGQITTDLDNKTEQLRRIARNNKYGKVQQQSAAQSQGRPFYQFDTRLKPYGKRSRAWYVLISIFFAGVIALNIYLAYYMSAIVLVLLATLLFVSASQKNHKIKVSLYTNGLKLDNKFYPWMDFENFWILYEPPGLKQLHLKRHSKVIGELIIELLDEHPLKIRDLLLPLLPEDATKEERNIDFLSRTFKL